MTFQLFNHLPIRREKDAVLLLNVSLSEIEIRDRRSVELYWIVQRKYFIYEGESECFDGRSNDCYKAYRPVLLFLCTPHCVKFETQCSVV